MLWLKPDAFPRLSRAVSIVVIAAEGGLDPHAEGARTLARCPFRGCAELVLDARTNGYACATCGAQGNVVGLVMAVSRLPFVAALRQLAFRAGKPWTDFISEQCECTACRPAKRRTSTVPLWALTPPPFVTGEGR